MVDLYSHQGYQDTLQRLNEDSAIYQGSRMHRNCQ